MGTMPTEHFSEILLPLRSNAGWFTSVETRAALDRRLKNLVFAYDRVIVQDGQFSATVWKSGQAFNLMVPPAQIGGRRDDDAIAGPDAEPLLLNGGHVLGQGDGYTAGGECHRRISQRHWRPWGPLALPA